MNSTPPLISVMKNGDSTRCYDPVSASNGKHPSSQRPFFVANSKEKDKCHNEHKICEGFVLCIPSGDSDHAAESDDASDISDVTWMTFRMEQLREQFLRRGANRGLTYYQNGGRRESDGNISKLTNMGDLDVEFGRRCSVENDAEDEDDARVDEPVNRQVGISVPGIDSNQVNYRDAHRDILLEHIIELKLQLAQKQDVIDQLSGECKQLQSENDQLKKKLENSAKSKSTNDEDVFVDSPKFDESSGPQAGVTKSSRSDENKMIDSTNEDVDAYQGVFQLVHLEKEIVSLKPLAPRRRSFEYRPVLGAVVENVRGEVVLETSRETSSYSRSGQSGFLQKMCNKMRARKRHDDSRKGELLSDWGETDTVVSGSPPSLFGTVQV
mmetsp:Transcript_31244/g.60087  ORF Transcript_31244/g.60087 Transcript_31244/m.60087 type:complete len:382 (-) Transcript_31244:67-1212(-)